MQSRKHYDRTKRKKVGGSTNFTHVLMKNDLIENCNLQVCVKAQS